jgi:hypothetical protein
MLAAVAIADPVYPNRPIRIVTPYAPGGSTSVTGRLLSEHFTSRWRQNVIVDSQAAAHHDHLIVAKSLGDGYTLLLPPPAFHSVQCDEGAARSGQGLRAIATSNNRTCWCCIPACPPPPCRS